MERPIGEELGSRKRILRRCPLRHGRGALILSTDTQARSGEAPGSAKEQRIDTDARDEKASQENPKDEKSKDDKGRDAARQASSDSEGDSGEKDDKPAGTDLMATVLKRAVETITSEWALND